MWTTTLLHNGEGLAYLTGPLKISEEQNRVCQIADVDGGVHRRSDEAMLSQGEDSGDPLLAQIGKELVQLHCEELLVGHGIEQAVHAVDHQHAQIFRVYQLPHPGDELPW